MKADSVGIKVLEKSFNNISLGLVCLGFSRRSSNLSQGIDGSRGEGGLERI